MQIPRTVRVLHIPHTILVSYAANCIFGASIVFTWTQLKGVLEIEPGGELKSTWSVQPPVIDVSYSSLAGKGHWKAHILVHGLSKT